MLVFPEQFFWSCRSTAPLLDPFNASDHLVNGWFAIQRKYVVEEQFVQTLFGFSRFECKMLSENLDHHVRPAMPQPGKRAVEIENGMRNPRAGRSEERRVGKEC